MIFERKTQHTIVNHKVRRLMQRNISTKIGQQPESTTVAECTCDGWVTGEAAQ